MFTPINPISENDTSVTVCVGLQSTGPLQTSVSISLSTSDGTATGIVVL